MGTLKDNLNIPAWRRKKNPIRLQSVMTPRKKNRAGERTMSFLDDEGNWVNSVMIVGFDGLPVNMANVASDLDSIHQEMIKLNSQITDLIKGMTDV